VCLPGRRGPAGAWRGGPLVAVLQRPAGESSESWCAAPRRPQRLMGDNSLLAPTGSGVTSTRPGRGGGRVGASWRWAGGPRNPWRWKGENARDGLSSARVTTVDLPGQQPRRLPHPVLNALLICDAATRESENGKVTLHGIFENITAAAFPIRHASLVVYAKFTDAKGEYGIQLDLIRLETAEIVAAANGTVIARDRMGAVELVIEARDVLLPGPGLYEWRLQAAGRYLGSKTFTAVVASGPPSAGG
jgi:hypothetical protein